MVAIKTVVLFLALALMAWILQTALDKAEEAEGTVAELGE